MRRHDAERAARIQEARARGEPVRQIAQREGVSGRSVLRVTNRKASDLSPPSPSAFAEREKVSLSTVVYVRKRNSFLFEQNQSDAAVERDAKLREIAAHLDRPALKTWSAAHDAIVAAAGAIQPARALRKAVDAS